METLENISKKYRTDKGKVYHNYLELYEKYFTKYRNRLEALLEIGLWEGESIRMWREYFPCGTIVGADILDLSHIDLPNTTVLVCNQEERTHLREIINKSVKQFDIIIDDGGHWQHQQQITLGYMFPYLKTKGTFVIEDLHTAYNPAYTKKGDIATLDVLREWKSTGVLRTQCMTEEEINYLMENTLEINIEKGTVSEIAFIIKK
jgi:hypothetical protein